MLVLIPTFSLHPGAATLDLDQFMVCRSSSLIHLFGLTLIARMPMFSMPSIVLRHQLVLILVSAII